MECKGRLITVQKDWRTGKFQVAFEVDDDVSSQADSINQKDLKITAKIWREKRSLDSNAYYWVLLSRLAEYMKISKPCAHNMMLRRYGQNLLIDGIKADIRIPDTEKAEKMAMEASTYHIRPTSQTVSGSDGVTYRTYVMLKGSSDYDTREMSELIDGLV